MNRLELFYNCTQCVTDMFIAVRVTATECLHRMYTRHRRMWACNNSVVSHVSSISLTHCLSPHIPTVRFQHNLSPTINFSPLNTMRTLLYLKTQFVPRSKHFSSRLYKPISLCCKWHKSLSVLR